MRRGNRTGWKGLKDKNSDKLYAHKQLLPQSDYDARDSEIFERCAKIQENIRWSEKEL